MLKILPCFIFLLALSSCEKIPDEFSSIKGDYFWSYTQQVFYNGPSTYTYYSSAGENTTCSISIKNRKIIFYKNGRRDNVSCVKSVNQNSEGIIVTFDFPKGEEHTFLINGNQLISYAYPYQYTGNYGGFNYFLKE